VAYRPPATFMEVYAEGSVEEKDSSINENDYSQAMAVVALRLKY